MISPDARRSVRIAAAAPAGIANTAAIEDGTRKNSRRLSGFIELNLHPSGKQRQFIPGCSG